MGLSQIGRLEELLEKRQQVADWYAHYLARIEEVTPPQLVENTTRVSWFVYVIRVAKQVNRDRFAQILKERGVPVRALLLADPPPAFYDGNVRHPAR